MRSEFYSFNSDITTERIKNADIVWVIAPWLANDLKTRKFQNKKVLCSVYHLDESQSNNEDIENFKKFDQSKVRASRPTIKSYFRFLFLLTDDPLFLFLRFSHSSISFGNECLTIKNQDAESC